MSILDEIMRAQGGGAVQQLGQQFGLQDDQVASALSALVPALAAGFQRNMATPQGLDGLVSALSGGQHRRYVEETGALSRPETTADGNNILGHVFGSKEISRQVASSASAQTGIGESVLKNMLPVVAAMMMGSMGNRMSQPGSFGMGAPAGGGLIGMLTPLLDANRDGSMADDVLNTVGRLLSGRAGQG